LAGIFWMGAASLTARSSAASHRSGRLAQMPGAAPTSNGLPEDGRPSRRDGAARPGIPLRLRYAPLTYT